MIIQQCRESDLEVLARQNPSPRHVRWNEERFQRHQQGLTTFLIAWVDDVPAGAGRSGGRAAQRQRCGVASPIAPKSTAWRSGRPNGGRTVSAPPSSAPPKTSPCRPATGGSVWVSMTRTRVRPRSTSASATGKRAAATSTATTYVDDNGLRHDAADPCRILIKPVAATRPRARTRISA